MISKSRTFYDISQKITQNIIFLMKKNWYFFNLFSHIVPMNTFKETKVSLWIYFFQNSFLRDMVVHMFLLKEIGKTNTPRPDNHIIMDLCFIGLRKLIKHLNFSKRKQYYLIFHYYEVHILGNI